MRVGHLLVSICLLLPMISAHPALADPAPAAGRCGPFKWSVPSAGACPEAGPLLERGWAELDPDGAASGVRQVNQLAGQRSGRLSRPVYDAVLRALEWKERSQGAVDLLAGPLNRWRRQGGRGCAPDSLKALAADGGAYFVELGVLLRTAGMELDLSPVADGLLADRALDSLRGPAGEGLMLRVGGAWRTRGARLVLPAEETLVGQSVELTSGAAARADGGDGRLDPRTGCPPAEAWRVFVLAPRAEDARCWADACCLAGAQGLALLAGRPGVEACAVGPAGAGWRTPGFPAPSK